MLSSVNKQHTKRHPYFAHWLHYIMKRISSVSNCHLKWSFNGKLTSGFKILLRIHNEVTLVLRSIQLLVAISRASSLVISYFCATIFVTNTYSISCLEKKMFFGFHFVQYRVIYSKLDQPVELKVLMFCFCLNIQHFK